MLLLSALRAGEHLADWPLLQLPLFPSHRCSLILGSANSRLSLQSRESPFLIGAHKPRVARHIGGENGGQLAFDAFRGQSGAPQPHGPNRLSALSRTLLLGPMRLPRAFTSTSTYAAS